MRAAYFALSLLHKSREDRGKQGSSHFDEKLSFWKDTAVEIAWNIALVRKVKVLNQE